MTYFDMGKQFPTVLRDLVWKYVDPKRITPDLDLRRTEMSAKKILNKSDQMKFPVPLNTLSNSIYAGLHLLSLKEEYMRKESAMNLAALLKCKFLSQNHVDTDKDNRALRGAVYASFQDLYLEQQTHQKLKKEDALLSAIKLAPSLTLWLMKSFDQEAIKEYDHQCRNGKVSFAKMFDNELRARNLVDKRGDPISCEDMIKLLPTNTETLLNTVTISYNGLDVSVREFLEISRYEHYPWI